MVQYKAAALTLLLTTITPTTQAIQLRSHSTAFVSNLHPNRSTHNSRRYSAIPYNNDRHSTSSSEQTPSAETALQIVESQIDNLLPTPVGQDEEDESLLAKKEERIQARKNSEQKRKVFRVTLPIVSSPQRVPRSSNGAQEPLEELVAKGQEIALQNSVGMSLRQVYSGKRLSELALDVDTLRFQSFEDELQGRSVLEDEREEVECGTNGESVEQAKSVGAIQVLQNSALVMMQDTFDGVLVSSAARGGLAWEAGVRAGDVLIGTSATIGNVSACCWLALHVSIVWLISRDAHAAAAS
jgi:hypothetical protein